MSNHRGVETDFELTTLERLDREGYEYQLGTEIDRRVEDVVLVDRLERFLRQTYPDLPDPSIAQAVARFARPQGADLIRRNRDFHELATKGWEVPVEQEDGRRTFRHIYPIDWDDPAANEFLAVNQFPIRGRNDRRPDVLIFINGLPLVLFELKNPWEPNFTVEHALNQIAHYRNDIPQVFEFNAITVVSDGITTLHGMWPASMEWFAPWKSIDGERIEANTTGTMKTLIEGMFAKERLLAYIRDFIVFEEANDAIGKKGAKYHQFFAVRLAVAKAKDAFAADGDHRVGVIWHTTGSGKSLAMAFLVGIVRRGPEFGNPSIVVQVDATDLDDQLFDQFVAARSLVGNAQHADRITDLRRMLQTEGGELVFSTLQKFQLREGETQHPILSARSNILVIADEAHRSQYGFLQGYARYLRDALPNAMFLGFTGTPVSFASADTVDVFGDVIHTYDIKQSQEDGTTVPIFYEPRQVQLHLSRADVDAALQELVSTGDDPTSLERRKSRWAALASAAGAQDRVQELAQDLLAHFKDRTATLDGKALVVAMTRANCVKLYDALTALPECPDVKVVMTGDLTRDPEEWSRAGHITTKAQRDAIKQRMIDVDDPLSIVIVCDMWLTGTDIPCLHTLYVDKPMKNHGIIQAISRVNRVFRDKPHGLIVDYIGIGDDLRDATARYSEGGGRGDPAPSVEEAGRPIFIEGLAQVREALPQGLDYGGWRALSRIELEDRFALVYGYLTDDDRRESFLHAESRLSRAFLLVKHLDDCRAHADEVLFCQQVRKQILKTVPGSQPKPDLEQAVRDLVDRTIESAGVVDIFKVAGIERPDLSILDDEFLQTFKGRDNENLRVKLLEKLLGDEIRVHERRNLAQARSFRDLLEATLRKYHNRLIDAAAVIQEMIDIRKQLEKQHRRAAELGVTEEELAFYDALAADGHAVYDDDFLRDLVHEIVQTVKRNLKVDWTAPHRDGVRAAVRSAVKRTLRQRGVRPEDFDRFVEAVMEQAVATFAAWPLAAAA